MLRSRSVDSDMIAPPVRDYTFAAEPFFCPVRERTLREPHHRIPWRTERTIEAPRCQRGGGGRRKSADCPCLARWSSAHCVLRIPSHGLLDRLQGRLSLVLEPGHGPLRAEPRHLALGIAARLADDPFPCLLRADLAADQAHHLPIPERLPG